MYVVATAGHVDHGKSTLLRRLTGMEPDRWAEERRRGLTIDLGFVWTRLPSGQTVAFVDVPGHERFVPHMLAGIGPVPAVLFVVAADEGWMAQSAEHLAALDALGVRHGVLAITRADLADPEPARTQALDQLAGTSLEGLPAVAVSGLTGAGLDDLQRELAALTTRLPVPDAEADVRLWVDRSFTVRGAGTVVTGTLQAGTLRTGQELQLSGEPGRRVRIRGLQALGADRDEVTAVARVAVNLRGVEREAIRRGDGLLTPEAWYLTDTVDVRLRTEEPVTVPWWTWHVGSAAVPVRVRALDAGFARLTLTRALPLRVGDRGLLRDPGRHRSAIGVRVLDVRPPALTRRGAARARARELADADSRPGGLAVAQLRRCGHLPASDLRVMGLPPAGRPVAGEWYVEESHWAQLRDRAVDHVTQWRARDPLAPPMPVEILRKHLDVPSAVLTALLEEVGLPCADGHVHPPIAADDEAAALPPAVEAAIRAIEDDLAAAPFAAPEAHRLAELGLGRRELAAAARLGRVSAIAEGLVLLPDAVERATACLATLPQPFTMSQAKQALGTTRRVAVPLLELLARRGITVRLPDGTHRLR